mmetsp:Transcript_73760/g.159651  ORF Transcript_73760/g.159651 Transcript_73760/m.159651 type:complete len:291 (-) Transcript_73760:445-1317(-)
MAWMPPDASARPLARAAASTARPLSAPMLDIAAAAGPLEDTASHKAQESSEVVRKSSSGGRFVAKAISAAAARRASSWRSLSCSSSPMARPRAVANGPTTQVSLDCSATESSDMTSSRPCRTATASRCERSASASPRTRQDAQKRYLRACIFNSCAGVTKDSRILSRTQSTPQSTLARVTVLSSSLYAPASQRRQALRILKLTALCRMVELERALQDTGSARAAESNALADFAGQRSPRTSWNPTMMRSTPSAPRRKASDAASPQRGPLPANSKRRACMRTLKAFTATVA